MTDYSELREGVKFKLLGHMWKIAGSMDEGEMCTTRVRLLNEDSTAATLHYLYLHEFIDEIEILPEYKIGQPYRDAMGEWFIRRNGGWTAFDGAQYEDGDQYIALPMHAGS